VIAAHEVSWIAHRDRRAIVATRASAVAPPSVSALPIAGVSIDREHVDDFILGRLIGDLYEITDRLGAGAAD
jgi:hypothetical protein